MKYDHACTSIYKQRISANLFMKELKIEIIDESDKVVDVFGNSLIRNHLDVTFAEKYKPAYEKLLEWVISTFSKKKELKKYKLFWG